jgi:hypothetical protein
VSGCARTPGDSVRGQVLAVAIEHLVSGTSSHFRSLEQLLEFIRRLVRDAT